MFVYEWGRIVFPRLSGPPTVLRMTQSFVSSLPMPAFLPNSSFTTSTTSSCGKKEATEGTKKKVATIDVWARGATTNKHVGEGTDPRCRI